MQPPMEEPNQPITGKDLQEALDHAVQAIAAAVQAQIKATEERMSADLKATRNAPRDSRAPSKPTC